MPDSPIDLDAIRAREAAATPGPWHLRGRSVQADVRVSDDGPDDGIWNHSVVCSVGAWRSGRPTDADAAFIAAARTDVPLLLERVDGVERENERLWAIIGRVADLASAARSLGVTLDPAEMVAALEGVAAKETAA